MSSGSHATWLPGEGEAAAPAAAAQALSTAEPQVISGGARVDTSGLQSAEGKAGTARPQPTGRVLAEGEISAGGFFTERVVEVAETRQEAVVEKQVVVSEEVVLRKNATEHVETVDGKVRRTEVEVEELRAPDGAERLE
jgi:hypothetical protein